MPKVNNPYSDIHNRKLYNTKVMQAGLEHEKFFYEYDKEMVALRFGILEKYCTGKRVVDLGCGTGYYLMPVSKIAKEVIGIDFSQGMLKVLRAKNQESFKSNISLLQENIRKTSLENKSCDVIYSISTLYYVSDVEDVIFEMNRILKNKGIAIFEMGNLWSLNTLVVRRAPTGVKSFHVSLGEIRKIIKETGFEILEHRAFQILPMYKGPFYLLPLANPYWKIIMGKKIKGRMIDEIISSNFLFKHFAFRHLFICEKQGNL